MTTKDNDESAQSEHDLLIINNANATKEFSFVRDI